LHCRGAEFNKRILIKSKIMPINKNPVNKLSDAKFIEIEKDLIEYFNFAVNSNDRNTPIFQAKEFAIKSIAKKHGFTIEQAREVVSEMQMRRLDKNLNDKAET